MSNDQTPDKPHERLGRYLLVEKLTTGGMAEVFRGVAAGPEGFARTVAVKRILPAYADSPDFRRMFVDEATIAARLNHANIAQVYDFDIVDGTPYIAMELVEGKDLRNILQACAESDSPVPFPIAVSIALEMAKGLYYVHSRREQSRPLNIIHRDVSPQNIMLSYAGEVKLVDFGIARAAQRQSLTRAGTVKGKFGYMSPEQVQGREVDHRTDIFSLGVVLWEMLTVRRLFAGESEGETINNILHKRICPPHEVNPDVPPALSALVLKALSRERHERYPTMLVLYEELSRFLFETGSYPDVERLSQFVHGLFPEEMARMAQGEHLGLPETGTRTPPEPPPVEVTDTRVATPPTEEIRPTVPLPEIPPTRETATRPIGLAAPGQDAPETRRRLWLGLLLGLLVVALTLLFVREFMGKLQRDHQEPRMASTESAKVPETPGTEGPQNRGQSQAEKPRTAPEVLARADVRAQVLPPSEEPAQPPPEAPPPDVETGTDDPWQLGGGPGPKAVEPQPLEKQPAAQPQNKKPRKPEKQPAAQPQNEEIRITLLTDPEDAVIVIGEKRYDPGPIKLVHPPDKAVTVRVSKGGYAPIKDTFIPLPGMERSYELKAPAFLEIWVEPEDSVVKVADRELTRTGKLGHYVFEAGRWETIEVSVSRWGYEAVTERVTLADQKNKVTFQLRSKSEGGSLDAHPSYGFIKAQARPYANVFFGPDKEAWGETPKKRSVPVGTYEVLLVNDALGASHLCQIEVHAGHTSACYFDFEAAARSDAE